jgi:hypothetical protein
MISSSSASIDSERQDGNEASSSGDGSTAAAAEEKGSGRAHTPRARNKNHTRTSVIVIGAGMSGLACACELRHRGYNVLVVEARRRAGGRLNGSSIRVKPWQKQPLSEVSTTVSPQDDLDAYTNIDLGGALIHGVSENPIASLVDEMGLHAQPVSECLLLNSSGWPVDPREDDKVASLFNECLDIAFSKISEHDDADENANNTFGEIFRQVCEEKTVPQSTLLQWHQSNLEVSCGAGFDRLGHKWNEDEQYGYDGDHVAIQKSWKAVTDAMAEGLDILYDSPVKHIQVLHPQTNYPTTASQNKAPAQSKQRNHRSQHVTAAFSPRDRPVARPVNLPSRLSQRIRGVAAGTRRSARPRIEVDRFTIDPTREPPQRASSSSKTVPGNGGDDTMVRVTLQNDVVLEAHAVVCPLGYSKVIYDYI